MNKILTLIFLILISAVATSQVKPTIPFMPDSLKKIVLMQPTGLLVDSLPEMILVSDTTTLYKVTMSNMQNSFINEFLDLYFIAQIYLKNKHELDLVEPAYLSLSENQGGFAKFGFLLKEGNGHSKKINTPYVDITKTQAMGPPNKLMSITQLYPHEMGHILFHLLSHEDTIANNTKNVDMHFFSIITDYSTAFNEGFAEHIENVSRAFEKNDEIKKGIISDIESIGKSSQHFIKGFERDFIYPFRLGYYKASMLNWYQKYEDYKRFQHAHNGDVRYKNSSLTLTNLEDQLTFRNAGVGLNKNEKRNLVQLHSTEGAISSFFTQVSTSTLGEQYLDTTFYRTFLYDSTSIIQSPERIFTPLQNQFIKYFVILHNDVVFNNSSKSQFSDFIDGYVQRFPAEKDEIERLFKNALGTTYTNQLPPPLWILVKNHQHRLLTFDPFGAITVPLYTFDLNAAEVEDLETINGISKDAAKIVVEYRNTNGFFTDFKQLNFISELTEEQISKIISAALEEAYFENTLKDFEPKLSISALISSPLKYIFSRAGIYFLFLFSIIHFLFRKYDVPATLVQTILLFIKYLLLWVVFVLLGLVSVFLFQEYVYLYFFLFPALLLLLTPIVFRKKKIKMYRTFVFLGAMSLSIFISLI